MVHRAKDFSKPPAGLNDTKCDTVKNDVLLDKNNHEADKKCYRDTTIEALVDLYKDKCAACERDRGIELQVDHFRPYKARDNKTDTQYNQPGYYWLTYAWSNLIPLCSTCNRKKSNKFPLSTTGIRIDSHLNTQKRSRFLPNDINWLNLIEVPLIIKPETDQNTGSHFEFDKNGKMIGRTNFGIETIKIYQLNRRELKRKRIGVKNEIVNDITLSFSRFLNHKSEQRFKGNLETVFDRIVHGTNIDHELSLYYTFILRYFDYFIGGKLIGILRSKALDYFNEYKIENNLLRY